MKTRIISGLAMVPLAALVYFGGWPFWCGIFLISIIGIKEFYDAFKNGTSDTPYPIKPIYWVGFLAVSFSYIGPIIYTIPIWESFGTTYTMIPGGINRSVPVVFLFLMYILFQGGGMEQERFLRKLGVRKIFSTVSYKTGVANVLITLLGYYYIGGFFRHLMNIDILADYRTLIWLVFITAFGTDVMAYFTGYFLGKHKLCPKISPKKTIEGSVGGILGSALLCGLFGWIVIPHLFIHCIVMGFVGSIIAQMGDLTASVFKRKLNIKDYGNLIPGHGGVLDRFDSVLFTAPFVYYYIIFIIG